MVARKMVQRMLFAKQKYKQTHREQTYGYQGGRWRKELGDWHWHVHHWCACACVSMCSVMPDSLQPHGLQLARLLGPWDFPGKHMEWAARPSLGALAQASDACLCVSCTGTQAPYRSASWEAVKDAPRKQENEWGAAVGRRDSIRCSAAT